MVKVIVNSLRNPTQNDPQATTNWTLSKHGVALFSLAPSKPLKSYVSRFVLLSWDGATHTTLAVAPGCCSRISILIMSTIPHSKRTIRPDVFIGSKYCMISKRN